MAIDTGVITSIVQRVNTKLLQIERQERAKVFPNGTIQAAPLEGFKADCTYLLAIRSDLIDEGIAANEAAALEEPAPEDLTPGNRALALAFDISTIQYRLEELMKGRSTYLVPTEPV